MKVRNKFGGGHTYEVVEGLVVKDQHGILHTVEKTAFEEVPDDCWQDVTGECELWPEGEMYPFGIRHNGRLINRCGHEVPPNYRLRKVQVYPYQQPTEIKCWAFVVEQKVPYA